MNIGLIFTGLLWTISEYESVCLDQTSHPGSHQGPDPLLQSHFPKGPNKLQKKGHTA